MGENTVSSGFPPQRPMPAQGSIRAIQTIHPSPKPYICSNATAIRWWTVATTHQSHPEFCFQASLGHNDGERWGVSRSPVDRPPDLSPHQDPLPDPRAVEAGIGKRTRARLESDHTCVWQTPKRLGSGLRWVVGFTPRSCLFSLTLFCRDVQAGP